MLLLLLPVMPLYATKDNDSEDRECYLEETDDEEEEHVKDPGRRHRLPSQHVLCVISMETGISIPGMDSSEIVGYEIRDASGNTVAILADEASFIETLFSLSGEYRLIFRLPGRTLAGWINI